MEQDVPHVETFLFLREGHTALHLCADLSPASHGPLTDLHVRPAGHVPRDLGALEPEHRSGLGTGFFFIEHFFPTQKLTAFCLLLDWSRTSHVPVREVDQYLIKSCCAPSISAKSSEFRSSNGFIENYGGWLLERPLRQWQSEEGGTLFVHRVSWRWFLEGLSFSQEHALESLLDDDEH